MRSLSRRASRVVAASLAGVLSVTGLSAVLTPASAYTGHALPGVTLERAADPSESPDVGVKAEVTESTSLFQIDLRFPLLGDGLDCSLPENRNAEFRWELATRPEDVGQVSQADITKVATLCTSASDGVLHEIKVSNSVRDFDPNTIVNVLAEVEKAGTSLLPESGPTDETSIPKLNKDEHWIGVVQMPHAPVWVGIGDGYTIPANVPGEMLGSFSFAVEAGRRFPREFELACQLIGAFAFEAARRLTDPRGLSIHHLPILTDRQRDCVLWAARGKTDWEIAQILGVSHETVIQHLKHARERYGVQKRALLAVRALFDGLISFSDILKH